MKQILKLLARLYPAEWRARYGAEYEALLDEGKPRVRDAVDVFWGAFKMQMTSWRFVWTVLGCMLVGSLAAVAVSFARPTLYRSQTLITVQTSSSRSIDRELAGLMQDFLAAPSLIAIIQREGLYPRERERMPMNDVVGLMRKNTWIRALSTSDGKPASAFVLQFYYPDPQIAQRVDARLVSLLMAQNLRVAVNAPPGSRASVTFSVPAPPDLPQRPFFPNRPEFGAVGLCAGLVGGFVVAGIGSWRRRLDTVAAD